MKKSCLKIEDDDCSTSNHSTTSSGGAAGRKRSCGDTLSVSFRSIDIHEFSMELGDNPACASGVPVQIGWEPHTSINSIDIDVYEQQRTKSKSKSRTGKRRGGTEHSRRDLLISAEQRRKIVTSQGTPIHEILDIIQQTLQIKADRKESIENMKWDQWEFKFEKLKRIMKKLRIRKSSSSRSTTASMSA